MIYLDEAAGRWYADGILQAAASRHFYTFNLLRKETWEPVVRAWETEMHAELWSRYQLDNFGALLVAAFRYAPDALPESSASRAERGLPALPAVSETDSRACSIGRFARANWYHEVLARLSDCARLVTEEAKSQGKALFSPRQWHRFVNSKFPEKALAIAAGLGTIGRNGLVIARRTDLTGFLTMLAAVRLPVKLGGPQRWFSASCSCPSIFRLKPACRPETFSNRLRSAAPAQAVSVPVPQGLSNSARFQPIIGNPASKTIQA